MGSAAVPGRVSPVWPARASAGGPGFDDWAAARSPSAACFIEAEAPWASGPFALGLGELASGLTLGGAGIGEAGFARVLTFTLALAGMGLGGAIGLEGVGEVLGVLGGAFEALGGPALGFAGVGGPAAAELLAGLALGGRGVMDQRVGGGLGGALAAGADLPGLVAKLGELAAEVRGLVAEPVLGGDPLAEDGLQSLPDLPLAAGQVAGLGGVLGDEREVGIGRRGGEFGSGRRRVRRWLRGGEVVASGEGFEGCGGLGSGGFRGVGAGGWGWPRVACSASSAARAAWSAAAFASGSRAA